MGRKGSNQTNKTINKYIGDWNFRHRTKTPERGCVKKKQIKTNKINYFFAKKKYCKSMSDTYFTYSNQNLELKYCLRCFLLTKMLAQLNGHWAEGLWPTTIKSHVVKIVITWSIRLNENNNIELVYIQISKRLWGVTNPIVCQNWPET